MSDLLEMRAERLGCQQDCSDTELEMRLGNWIWRKRGRHDLSALSSCPLDFGGWDKSVSSGKEAWRRRSVGSTIDEGRDALAGGLLQS